MNNIFVLGLDGFNREKLEAIRQSDSHRFHGLLEVSQVSGAQEFDFEALLKEATKTLEGFQGSVDGIVNFWDFPASAIHAILCERYDLPGPSLESVVKCDHKYWSRLEQKKVVPKLVPEFHAFDPFDEKARDSIPMDYPFWVKPFLSYSSYLAFPVKDDKTFYAAMAALRQGADRYGEPFLDMMDHVEGPVDRDVQNPHLCLAEAPLMGHQCTVEGFCLHKKTHSHGIIDTHWFGDDSDRSRYQYPSKLPEGVQAAMERASSRLMEHIGYDYAGFNIEYYHDAERDRFSLLEVNSRVSQSHSHIFEMVDGRSNHEIAVSVAEGQEPQMPSRQGTHPVAAKFFMRSFIEDGYVETVPSREQVSAVEQEFPGTLVQLSVEPGMRLSQILDQDTYSHRLAMVHTAARDEKELIRRFDEIQNRLRFGIRPLETSPTLT